MISQIKRVAVLLLISLVSIVGSLAGSPPVAHAQSQVVGTADFRNAPQLVPGTYTDRLVTGDSAWYSLVYSNDTPYQFDVKINGAAPPGVKLTASFVAPTLTTIDGPAATVTGNGVVYPSGHTNVWFLKVSLESTGQVGLEYPVTISVSGVQSEGVAECGDTPGCVLDDEYAALKRELTEAQEQLAEMNELETTAVVTNQINNLRGFADTAAKLLPVEQSRLAGSEARLAQLCAPNPVCQTFPDQGSKVPILGWGVGALALLGGAYAAANKFNRDDEPEEKKIAPRAPSAIEKARREGVARKKAEKKAERKRK